MDAALPALWFSACTSAGFVRESCLRNKWLIQLLGLVVLVELVQPQFVTNRVAQLLRIVIDAIRRSTCQETWPHDPVSFKD